MGNRKNNRLTPLISPFTNSTNTSSNSVEGDYYEDEEFIDDESVDDFNYYDEEYDDDSGYIRALRYASDVTYGILKFLLLSRRKGERGNRYEIKLKTFEPDGLVLWRSKEKSLKEPYFSIAIVNGYPELSYNLGKQEIFWAIR